METVNNSKLENWIHLSSTIAVLVGVLLVVIQLRQNSELIELQIMKDDANSFIEAEVSLLPENIYEIRQKSLDEPENLTLYEYQVLDAFYWATGVTRWRSLCDLAERDLLDAATSGSDFGSAAVSEFMTEQPDILSSDVEVSEALATDPRSFWILALAAD